MTGKYRIDPSPGTIIYGRGCVNSIETELSELGLSRALVVCGRTVGSTPEVVGPVEEGVGDRLAGVFDETTPEKKLSTVFDGVDIVREQAVDVLVSLGGGSSLDVAKVMSIVASSDRSYRDVREEFERTRQIPIPDTDLLPIVTVPTTLAGADLSAAVGITSRRDGLIRGIVADDRLMPVVLFYDPALFATTPHRILCSSAMNGFDKAVEAPYSPNATPLTDATAIRSLRLLSASLPQLGDGERDDNTLHDAIMGTVLAQYGSLRESGRTTSLIHALGHEIARGYDIQQGTAHGIIAPAVLRYIFGKIDGGRGMLAEGLGMTGEASPDETATFVIEKVAAVRDALGLQDTLRSVETLPESDLPELAESVYQDLHDVPEGLDPTVDEIEGVLINAW